MLGCGRGRPRKPAGSSAPPSYREPTTTGATWSGQGPGRTGSRMRVTAAGF
ncbi:hypothetical protein EHZ25_38060 [Paraburkholderia tropica]|nr:hypothetical protein EHZ25_38060 [Paraburkholderia tropica]